MGEPCKECADWKQFHETNELCINNQFAEIKRLRNERRDLLEALAEARTQMIKGWDVTEEKNNPAMRKLGLVIDHVDALLLKAEGKRHE